MSAGSSKRLAVDSRLAEVRRLGGMVRSFCLEAGLDAELAGSMELAVVEAANNIIKHAYLEMPGNKVEVELRREPGRLVIDVSDWGRPIPEEKKTAPSAPEFDPNDPAGLQEGGMGLYIIHQVMDQAIRSHNGGRNTLTMVKEVPGT
jgi:anti-sigma regulatory factor (Ser/Thr protein kinase)